MQGAGVFEGDILVVDRHVTARNGDAVIENFNGEFICKLLDVSRRAMMSIPPRPSLNKTPSPLKVWCSPLFAVTDKVRFCIRVSRCQFLYCSAEQLSRN